MRLRRAKAAVVLLPGAAAAEAVGTGLENVEPPRSGESRSEPTSSGRGARFAVAVPRWHFTSGRAGRWAAAMMDMIAVTDAQKVGLMLVGCGALFLALGSLLLFDRALLTIGNLLFLSGFPFLSGPWATLAFFSPIPLNLDFSGPWWHRARAAGCFWLGFILVLARWTLVGMLVEVVGIVLLFARFAKPLVRIGQSIPLLGSLLQLPGVVWLVNIIDDEAGRARPKV